MAGKASDDGAVVRAAKRLLCLQMLEAIADNRSDDDLAAIARSERHGRRLATQARGLAIVDRMVASEDANGDGAPPDGEPAAANDDEPQDEDMDPTDEPALQDLPVEELRVEVKRRLARYVGQLEAKRMGRGPDRGGAEDGGGQLAGAGRRGAGPEP